MHITIGDTNLFYEVIGEGIPIFFVHGWGMDHRIFSGCMEPIFENDLPGFQRIYVDLPGMGQSTPGENIHNADQVLDLLLILLDVLVPAERFILAGESFGGYLIRGIARERRKDIRGMLFVCPLIKPGYRKGNVEPMEVFSYDVDDIESPYDMPALFLVGKNDTEVGYRDAFSLMDQYVDSTYVAISHTGHNMQIEAPDLFAANVTLWLENTQNVKKTFS